MFNQNYYLNEYANPQSLPTEIIQVYKPRYNHRFGKILNQQKIAEYSMTVDREVLNDRSNARFLVEGNIRDNVQFDLKRGLETFTDRCAMMQMEPPLWALCKWANAQSGQRLREVFWSDFAARRGTIKRIAATILAHHPQQRDAWTIVAHNLDGVILLGETSKIFDGDSNDLATYSGFKFEQCMTADRPNNMPDMTAPIDNRPTFEMMIRSELHTNWGHISLCCAAEVDALRNDEPVELKTVAKGKEHGFFRKMNYVLQSELAGGKSVVVGLKNSDYIMDKVVEWNVAGIKHTLNNEEQKCYAFLYDVLTKAKQVLERNEICSISYDPFSKTVSFTPVRRSPAVDQDNGVTIDFLKKFNINY